MQFAHKNLRTHNNTVDYIVTHDAAGKILKEEKFYAASTYSADKYTKGLKELCELIQQKTREIEEVYYPEIKQMYMDAELRMITRSYKDDYERKLKEMR